MSILFVLLMEKAEMKSSIMELTYPRCGFDMANIFTCQIFNYFVFYIFGSERNKRIKTLHIDHNPATIFVLQNSELFSFIHLFVFGPISVQFKLSD